MLPMQEIQAPALVRELRSHMLCRAAKRFKKETKKKRIEEYHLVFFMLIFMEKLSHTGHSVL